MSPVDPRLHLAFGGMGAAFIDLGRCDEAIIAGKKAQRQNPSFAVAYRCLASAFAHLGRDAEAREAAARLLEVDPDFTITAWIARGGQPNSKLRMEGCGKAGVPEGTRGRGADGMTGMTASGTNRTRREGCMTPDVAPHAQ